MILPILIPVNTNVPFVRISRWSIAGLTYGHLLLYYIPLALYSWSLPKNSIEGQLILFVIYFLFSSVLYGATWLFNQQFISKKEYYETIGKIK